MAWVKIIEGERFTPVYFFSCRLVLMKIRDFKNSSWGTVDNIVLNLMLFY